MKILISTSSFGKYDDAPVKKLTNSGYEIVLNPYKRTLKNEETGKLLNGITGLIAGTEQLTCDMLKQADKLKVISRCGTGMDNVDLKAAEQLGIKVFNTPDAPAQAVAELTLGLILALYRNIPGNDREVRSGKWEKGMGKLLQGKVLGILGLGRIGRKLVELTAPFGLLVVACDVNPDISFVEKHKIKLSSMEELLSTSDIVSIHVSYGTGTKNLIDKKKLALMKHSSILINTSRGGVINEGALAEALAGGGLAGAALDVFENEPYAGPLKGMDKVILTPHIGSYAVESRVKMEMDAVDNLIKGLL